MVSSRGMWIILSMVLLLVLLIIFAYFQGTNIWKLGKVFLDLDEGDIDSEDAKFKAIDVFNELVDKLDKCVKSKKNDCNCFIKEIPDFPSTYTLNFIKSSGGIEILLKDKSDTTLISNKIKGVGLCYLNKKYTPNMVNEAIINFDKKPYYTNEKYKFDSDLSPFYKYSKVFLCLVTDDTWVTHRFIGGAVNKKEDVQQVMYSKPFCNY